MRAQLIRLWQSRSPRDRAIIAALTVVLGVALYITLVQTASRSRMQLGKSVSTLRAQAARLDQYAVELERLRAAPVVSASQTDLRSLVQAQATEAGLAHALVRVDAVDTDHVVVVFGAVAFADWLAWIGALNAQHVRLDTSRVEALSTPGLVSVTATLARAKPQ
jgi:type II secretory pathway component PulM